MPLYTVSSRAPLPAKAKSEIAMMITDVHCSHTGAPRTFVQVLFSEHIPLSPGTELHIFASVRAGRSLQTNDLIEQNMVDQMSKLSNVDLSGIEFAIFGVPASWIMEGGVVLPEPGDEEQWLKENNHAG